MGEHTCEFQQVFSFYCPYFHPSFFFFSFPNGQFIQKSMANSVLKWMKLKAVFTFSVEQMPDFAGSYSNRNLLLVVCIAASLLSLWLRSRDIMDKRQGSVLKNVHTVISLMKNIDI